VICYANSFHGKQDISDIRKEDIKVKESTELMENGAV